MAVPRGVSGSSSVVRPAETLGHVAVKVRLGELAVARDVDADFGLLGHHVRDALADQGFECRLVALLAAGRGQDRLEDLRRPHQAADVGGQDAFAAAFHTAQAGLSERECPEC